MGGESKCVNRLWTVTIQVNVYISDNLGYNGSGSPGILLNFPYYRTAHYLTYQCYSQVVNLHLKQL